MFDDERIEEQEQVEQEIIPEEQPSQETEQPQERPNDKNIRQLRENAEQAARERDEAYRMIEEFKKAQQQQAAQPEEDDDINLADDDFAEGKHLSKMGRKIKKLEQTIKEYEVRTSQTTTEVKLKTQYPDFDNVVNNDTISKLRETYPDIAASLSTNPDMYSKATSAYTLIKKLGIYKEDTYNNDRDRVQSNSNKPRPAVSLNPQHGDSPLSHANAFAQGLTPDLKQALYKEMLESSRKSS